MARKWTKETCAEVAKRFMRRSDFYRFERSCYSQACRGKWLDEICTHMVPGAAKYERWIYVIKSEVDRNAYVGLTCDLQSRIRGHRNRARRPSMRALLDGPHCVEIISGPHVGEDAKRAEADGMALLKEQGWTLLNVATPGALGGTARKWTKPACLREARKYQSRGEFYANSTVAYYACINRGWMDEATAHMPDRKKHRKYWTKDRCAEAALKCATRREFRKRFPNARQIAQRNGWADEICKHMTIEKRPNGYWTLDRCKSVFRECRTRGEFAKRCPAAYDAAWKRGWLSRMETGERAIA